VRLRRPLCWRVTRLAHGVDALSRATGGTAERGMPASKERENTGPVVSITTRTKSPVLAYERAGRLVEEAVLAGKERGWYYLLGYVVMPDHLHLIIRPRGREVSAAVQAVKSLAGRRVNALLGKKGALWRRGFAVSVIEDQAGAKRTIKYVEANPVRDGLASTPEGYRLSSAHRREVVDPL